MFQRQVERRRFSGECPLATGSLGRVGGRSGGRELGLGDVVLRRLQDVDRLTSGSVDLESGGPSAVAYLVGVVGLVVDANNTGGARYATWMG
mmetsp:Transcript_124153/g.185573  ORF Transcript_124153/g.185573 Transcript_124153/m.185573 type:complete len:92 (-) Transcript_124153:91-366(-)